MILSVTATLPTYKAMKFTKGLNIVLAEKHAKSTEQHTRNGAGKSSLVEIFHFLLGGSTSPIFKTAALSEVTFSGEFVFGSMPVTVHRSSTTPNVVSVILPHDSSALLNDKLEPLFLNGGRVRELKVADWNEFLTKQVFQLECVTKKRKRGVQSASMNARGTGEDHCLTARILFNYIIRRQSEGGFQKFTESFSKQAVLPQQSALMYMLGLDWTIAQKWQIIEDRLRTIRSLTKLAETAEIEDLVPKAEEILSQLAVERSKLLNMQRNFQEFKVLPEYRQIEIESNEIAIRLRQLTDEASQLAHRLDTVDQALSNEITQESENLQVFIQQVQGLFKDSVTARLEQVRAFHDSVMRNREEYLRQEVRSLKTHHSDISSEQTRLLRRQSEVLTILKASGGLDQYNKLHRELVRQESKVEALEEKHKRATEISFIQAECDEAKAVLAHRLVINYSEQTDDIQEAVSLYQNISERLFEEAGYLIVGKNDNTKAPQISVHKSSSRSKGINNMQIFTFDLVATVLMKHRGVGPGFLIHDSHIFDGVDSRQVKTAIRVAREICDEYDLQYILCLNSDQLEEKDAFNENIVNPILYDHMPEGKLFGFNFD